MMDRARRRIGIVGYGHLGKFLVNQILLREDDLELVFVWNRTSSVLRNEVDEKYILEDLSLFADRKPDLIVEVAHPLITAQFGVDFLKVADYLVGSPTTFADIKVEESMREAATTHGLYIPSGAFWGAEDIKKMADRGTLQKLKVTMSKHPSCFRLNGELFEKNKSVTTERTVLYEGSVRGLCPLAPNNVNTMAAAAMVAHNLGFDKVEGSLVSDPMLTDWHVVEVDVWGPGDIESGSAFHVKTTRNNPAKAGVVTGSATSVSFISSLLGAHGKGPGVHFC
ncbi:aspartate dehydrogenase domain-containing protein-like [Tubulanus polymorphus]|uniref:aspartate dehydrogenase domain-containing protein-like n=1 Tax=Tubulanus polymorphus TaxID=672921 RepID=UPI003DA1C9F1